MPLDGSVNLGSRRIEYSVVRGNSRRYTYFRLLPDLTLEVIVPRGSSVNVEREIRERANWIKREFHRLSRTSHVLTKDGVMFGGVHLKFIRTSDTTDRLIPDFVKGEVLISASDERGTKELVRRWFLKDSSAYVVRRVGELAPLVKVYPSRVDVREIGKWGYCTRTGRLSFSWQLIALPERLRDYVVLHELVHLAEFNHSRRFRERLAAVCPDFRDRERDLDLVIPYERLGKPA